MPCRYISGENVQQEKVNLTVPVLNTVLVEWRGGKRIVYEKMCFFIGGKQQASPPTPTEPGVEISDPAGGMRVYVHTFGGNATQNRDLKEAKKFADKLRSLGKYVFKPIFFTASYDDLTKSTNRKNEVMFLVQSRKDGSSIMDYGSSIIHHG